MSSSGATQPSPPLTGIRVLDLTRVLSGPYCALILGELGADVVKVERPGRGDHARRPRDEKPGETGLRFLAWNMYKRSVTLDIWSPEGKDIFKKLVEHYDIVLENFRPNVMRDAELDYGTLREINPGIVMVSISGFGQQTTLAQHAAHSSVISAFTGLQHMNRFGDSAPWPAPGLSPDITAGAHAAIGALAAVIGRATSGEGRHVDVSMVDCMLGYIAFDIMSVLLTGSTPRQRELRAEDGVFAGKQGPSFHECYLAKDGWFYVQADLTAQWERLATAIGRPELVTDPRFETERKRSENREALNEIFSVWLGERTREEAFDVLGSAGVPCSPAYSIEEVPHLPYLRERGVLQDIEDPRHGTMAVLTPRLRFVGEDPLAPTPAPELGADTAEVLSEIGIDAVMLDDLRERGVV